MHMEDLVPGGTTGSSSVAAEGKTKYIGTEAVIGQVDHGESLWKFSSALSMKEEARSFKNEKGRGDSGGMRREHRVDCGGKMGYGC